MFLDRRKNRIETWIVQNKKEWGKYKSANDQKPRDHFRLSLKHETFNEHIRSIKFWFIRQALLVFI